MGTSISRVDYKDIPNKTRQLREEAQNLNSQVTQAFTSVSEMSANWYGKRYNTLVDSFNKMVDSLNEMLKLVVSDIPDTLDQVATNYARVDGETISRQSQMSPKRITPISKSNQTGMRFLENSVNSTKQNVEKNFQSAVNSMGQIKNIYDTIDWESDASRAFDSKLSQLKSEIEGAFNEIKGKFTELMNQTISDMHAAESANTVS